MKTLVWITAVGAIIGAAACGSGDERPSPGMPAAGAAGKVGSSAGAAGRPPAGTGGASGGSAAGNSPIGGGTSSLCGNGALDAGEECDGAALPSCESLGYGAGELRCEPSCTVDSSGCERIERCADGRDNDDDGSADCNDADCADQCASVCSAPEPLVERETRLGSNAERSAKLPLSCSPSSPGPGVAYRLTAERTGFLDVNVQSDTLLDVAIRSVCSSLASEKACALGSASARVTANQTVFIIVQGLEGADTGDFTIEAVSRPADVCGDGVRDDAEACEDGNVEAGDGCNAECELETTEGEPNDVPAEATPYAAPYFAEIQPADDVDAVSVVVTSANTTLMANVLNLGDGACAKELMDSVLELVSSTGRSLALDDDAGDGLCSRLVVPGLAAGTYGLLVRAAPGAEPATFPYQLAVTLDTCGNGATSPVEECDDGNLLAGDGCSATCTDE